MSKRVQQLMNISKMRILIIIVSVLALFSVYILQLLKIQFIDAKQYEAAYSRSLLTTFDIDEPRGNIVDANGVVLVSNTPEKVITYIKYRGIDLSSVDDVSKELSTMIEIKQDDVLKNEQKDVYFSWKKEEIRTKNKAIVEDESLDAVETEKALIETITNSQLQEMKADKNFNFSENYIKLKMTNASVAQPVIVKSKNVTDKEFATVAEHLDKLPGVDASYQWNRNYVNGASQNQSLFGNVTSATQGLPLEKKEYYEALGYNASSRVGVSGIEQQYEQYLRGSGNKYTYQSDKNGNYSKALMEPGKQGYSLKLNINNDLQQKTNAIVEKAILDGRAQIGSSDELTDAYVVVSDVKTGKIITMTGKKYIPEKNSFQDVSLQAAQSVYFPGSSIKGATVAAGYQTGVLQVGDVLPEITYNLGGLIKSSHDGYPLTSNSVEQALTYSSNSFMWQLIIEAGGGTYVPNETVYNLSPKSVDDFRKIYHQFGLGIKTGVDLPDESSGREVISSANASQESANRSDSFLPGEIMDLSIGQFDSYTALQLNQYGTTIANRGCRMQPYLVDSVYQVNENNEQILIQQNTPTVQNCISNMTKEQYDSIVNGFIGAAQTDGGTAYETFHREGDTTNWYNPAFKTGTAQVLSNGVMKNNGSGVGFAPANNPEIAISVLVPTYMNDGASFAYQPQIVIGKLVMDAYFNSNSYRK